jgi:cytochrome b6-f complex iron-sulfur subunit
MPDEPTQEKRPARTADEKAPARLATELSASGSHAVVVAAPAQPPGLPTMPNVSRRQMVIGGWWAGLLGLLAIGGYSLVNVLWPRTAQRLAGEFKLDAKASDIAEGTKKDVVVLVPNKQNPLQSLEAKVYLVHLSADQAARNPGGEGKAGAYLALSRKCPHLGCTVPFRTDFTFTDPLDGKTTTGWFRCPCHGSTYTDTGRRVFGPAPRSMDVYALTVADDGTMSINLSQLYTGALDNAIHAVKPGETPQA